MMMKKRKNRVRYIWLFIGLFVLSACDKKKIEPTDVAESLIEAVVYQHVDDFSKYFINNEEMLTSLQQDQIDINQAVGKITEHIAPREVNENIQELMKQMNQKAGYTLFVREEDHGQYAFIYDIYGLDYLSMLEEVLTQFLVMLDQDIELQEQTVLQDKLLNVLLYQHIEDISVNQEPIRITVFAEQKENLWYISDEEYPYLVNLYLSSLTGQKNIDEFSIAVTDVLETLVQKENKRNQSSQFQWDLDDLFSDMDHLEEKERE